MKMKKFLLGLIFIFALSSAGFAADYEFKGRIYARRIIAHGVGAA